MTPRLHFWREFTARVTNFLVRIKLRRPQHESNAAAHSWDIFDEACCWMPTDVYSGHSECKSTQWLLPALRRHRRTTAELYPRRWFVVSLCPVMLVVMVIDLASVIMLWITIIKQNWNQFFSVVKATTQEQQIPNFYSQIHRTLCVEFVNKILFLRYAQMLAITFVSVSGLS